MAFPSTPARPVRVALSGSVSPADACLLVRGDERPFALAGAWAGGDALVGSEPVAVAAAQDDPFAMLDRRPALADGAPVAVGGGWFGYLGYRLGARLERVPPGPPRPTALPDFSLAYYDHLLRCDSGGQWWFEALWTDARAASLERRLALFRRRLELGARSRPVWVGTLAPSPQATSGHPAAVAACRERIAEGEIFQANVCLRLEGRWSGNPLDLFARIAGELTPRHAALVAGPWGALCSASPELFLRRRGRRVLTEPIKGTAPRESGAGEALSRSAKDRAENVMIVDLMRNDFGRVCEYGSVEVPGLTELREAPGVWHLVSTVSGTLRRDVGDARLLRATFPPGSVTGAPKIRAMRVIAELEATGREAYTGAIGYASPVTGLELNVAIRTLEIRGERIWLGAGGGVVADSDPRSELEEVLVKARPVVKAAGGELASVVGRLAPSLPFALTGGANRPDPARGVLSTMLIRDGMPVNLAAHLARLGHSAEQLYGQRLPALLEARIFNEAAAWHLARLRVLVIPADDGGGLDVELDAQSLEREPGLDPIRLVPVALPGGLGEHKWADRRLLAEIERRTGAVALLVDFDAEVLEAGHANVWIAEDGTLVTPPLDGRLLPGTIRARLLSRPPEGLEVREEPLSLGRLARADELLLTSSVRGVHPAVLAGSRSRFEIGARLRAALLEEELEVAAP
jgi:para-aminobenzoate synthetase / 4-amino-4-deoxychorismate lyase